MLIVGRRPQQRIMIGNDVVVTIISVAGNNVKVGVSAPRGIAVDREEIYERKQRENGNSSEAQRLT